MSIGSSRLRALSRSHISPSKTLLPFLYQTPTIQQWQPTRRPIARRNITSRSLPRSGADIPFEDEVPFQDKERPPASTITETEFAAFQKLYKRFDAQGRQEKARDDVDELDQIADEYYEDDEEPAPPSLDTVFDEALQGTRRKPKDRDEDALLPMDKATRVGRKKSAMPEAVQFKEMRLAERERIDNLLRTAPTDRALWQVLESEVIEKIRALDLDDANMPTAPPPPTNDDAQPTSQPTTHPDTSTTTTKRKPKPSKPKKLNYKPNPPTTTSRILCQNYPHHLLTALTTLRTHFPSSPLPASLLPTIKALGRSSHALGATTTLYKNMLRTAWIQQASYPTIDALLLEMDSLAMDLDADILRLLDAVHKEYQQAKSGALGPEMQMVYAMDMWVEGFRKIEAWRGVVADRLGVVRPVAVAVPTTRREAEGAPAADNRLARGNVDMEQADLEMKPVDGDARSSTDSVGDGLLADADADAIEVSAAADRVVTLQEDVHRSGAVAAEMAAELGSDDEPLLPVADVSPASEGEEYLQRHYR
ncbi:hypothetical protein BDW02DRAFT_568458 [Decorospora gaudefroyi]|uniref:Mtf2-like C-terminal domain-containing protein n=1 Tax=Decorospora gaudefroyi TaxID=184978 RepID=A0A6A5KH42_9PLEO|nr:hypothetical protein BDW02DRAFT_568458 [Decorospora gaudefroyi]